MDGDVGTFRLAGVSFYQRALARCSPGQPIRLIHEPDNPYDPMALRVVSVLGETIGYVPKRSWVHYAVHQLGRGVAGTINSLGEGRACLLGATIGAVVCDDEPSVQSYYPDQLAPEPPVGGFRYWVKSPGGGAQRAAVQI